MSVIHRGWTQTRVGKGTVAIHYAYSKWVGLKVGGAQSRWTVDTAEI